MWIFELTLTFVHKILTPIEIKLIKNYEITISIQKKPAFFTFLEPNMHFNKNHTSKTSIKFTVKVPNHHQSGMHWLKKNPEKSIPNPQKSITLFLMTKGFVHASYNPTFSKFEAKSRYLDEPHLALVLAQAASTVPLAHAFDVQVRGLQDGTDGLEE